MIAKPWALRGSRLLPTYRTAPLRSGSPPGHALFAKRAGRSFHIQTRFSKSEAAIELHSGIFGANVQTDGPDAFLYQGINERTDDARSQSLPAMLGKTKDVPNSGDTLFPVDQMRFGRGH